MCVFWEWDGKGSIFSSEAKKEQSLFLSFQQLTEDNTHTPPLHAQKKADFVLCELRVSQECFIHEWGHCTSSTKACDRSVGL